jgi:hypothetical protein
MSLVLVYDIAHEPDWRFENVLTDLAFRSTEWWSGLGMAAVPLHVQSGIITKVFWSGFGDWPEFTLTTDDGKGHDWTREVTSLDTSKDSQPRSTTSPPATSGLCRRIPGRRAPKAM